MSHPALLSVDRTHRANDTSLTIFGIATAIALGLFWPEIARGFCHLLVIASGATAP